MARHLPQPFQFQPLLGLNVLSFLGEPIWTSSIPEKEAIALMHEAIDEGVNFFDNAWDYLLLSDFGPGCSYDISRRNRLPNPHFCFDRCSRKEVLKKYSRCNRN